MTTRAEAMKALDYLESIDVLYSYEQGCGASAHRDGSEEADPTLTILTPPNGFPESYAGSKETSVYVELYAWLRAEGHALPASTPYEVVYVGKGLRERLRAAERRSIRKHYRLTGTRLEAEVAMVDLHHGPREFIGGRPIAGDVVLVIPEEAYGALVERLAKEAA